MSHPADHTTSDKVIERLWRALLFSKNPRRDRAMLLLFLQCTCSAREVIELREEDVDLAAGRIRWRRGGREMWEELNGEALTALRDYHRRERRGPCDRFFTTRLGHPVSRAQVARLFRFLEKETGVENLNPVTLRATRQRLLLQREPLRALMQWRRRGAAR